MEFKNTPVGPANPPETRAPNARDDGRMSAGKRYALAVAVLTITFLLGFIPSWISAHNARADRETIQARLAMAEMRVQLGIVTFEAARNNYADARALSTQFFENVRHAAEQTTNPEIKKDLEAALARRDEITAGLAQADPSVKEKLSQLYVEFPSSEKATR